MVLPDQPRVRMPIITRIAKTRGIDTARNANKIANVIAIKRRSGEDPKIRKTQPYHISRLAFDFAPLFILSLTRYH